MYQEEQDLLTKSEQIKHETLHEANTATRVGGMFEFFVKTCFSFFGRTKRVNGKEPDSDGSIILYAEDIPGYDPENGTGGGHPQNTDTHTSATKFVVGRNPGNLTYGVTAIAWAENLAENVLFRNKWGYLIDQAITIDENGNTTIAGPFKGGNNYRVFLYDTPAAPFVDVAFSIGGQLSTTQGLLQFDFTPATDLAFIQCYNNVPGSVTGKIEIVCLTVKEGKSKIQFSDDAGVNWYEIQPKTPPAPTPPPGVSFTRSPILSYSGAGLRTTTLTQSIINGTITVPVATLTHDVAADAKQRRDMIAAKYTAPQAFVIIKGPELNGYEGLVSPPLPPNHIFVSFRDIIGTQAGSPPTEGHTQNTDTHTIHTVFGIGNDPNAQESDGVTDLEFYTNFGGKRGIIRLEWVDNGDTTFNMAFKQSIDGGLTFTDIGSGGGGTTETGETIKTKLEALEGANKLNASALQNLNRELILCNEATQTDNTLSFTPEYLYRTPGTVGVQDQININTFSNVALGRKVNYFIDSKNTNDTLTGPLNIKGATTATVNGTPNTNLTLLQSGGSFIPGGGLHEIIIEVKRFTPLIFDVEFINHGI